jgi:hypothetical protein
MFLKVVRWYSDEPEDVVYDHEIVYECDSVHIHGGGDENVRFDIEGRRNISIQVSKEEDVSVYLMNDSGQTIDSYQWQRRPTPVVGPSIEPA